MKSKIIIIMFILLFALSINAFALDYTVEVTSSRNFYDDNTLTLQLSGLTTGNDYSVRFEKLDSNGNVVKVISTVTVLAESTTEIIKFDPNAVEPVEVGSGYPFRAVDDVTGEVIDYFFVMDRPSESFTSDGDYRNLYESIGIGDVVYNDYGVGLLHNPEDTSGVTVTPDGWIILHYRLPVASASNNYYIQIFDESDESQVLNLGSLTLYDYMSDASTPPVDVRRSFIVLNAGNSYPDIINKNLADSVFGATNNPFRMGLDNSVYTYALFDDSFVKVATGESVLFVTNESKLWELTSPRFTIREGSIKTWYAYRYDEVIANIYGNNIFEDFLTGLTYNDKFDTYQIKTEIKYRTEFLYSGEGLVRWDMSKTNNAINWTNGADGNFYYFYLTEGYEVYEVAEIDDALNNMLDSFGMSGVLGQLFFSVLIMIATSIGLAYINAGSMIILIANFGLVGVFSVLGFIPVWLIIGVLIFGGIGILSVINGNGGGQ